MAGRKRDYYEVLGVNREANADEIKKSYRKLARQYHPDVNKASDAEARFKEINEAYEVLSDDRKRAAYNQFGHAAVDGSAGGGGFTGDFSDLGGLGDIFATFFGGGFGVTRTANRRAPRRGTTVPRFRASASFKARLR